MEFELGEGRLTVFLEGPSIESAQEFNQPC